MKKLRLNERNVVIDSRFLASQLDYSLSNSMCDS